MTLLPNPNSVILSDMHYTLIHLNIILNMKDIIHNVIWTSHLQGVQVPAWEDDLGPALLRVQGPLQGPQAQGPGHVPARLEIQGGNLGIVHWSAHCGNWFWWHFCHSPPDIEFVLRNSSIFRSFLLPCMWFHAFSSQFSSAFSLCIQMKTGLKMHGTTYREEGMIWICYYCGAQIICLLPTSVTISGLHCIPTFQISSSML